MILTKASAWAIAWSAAASFGGMVCGCSSDPTTTPPAKTPTDGTDGGGGGGDVDGSGGGTSDTGVAPPVDSGGGDMGTAVDAASCTLVIMTIVNAKCTSCAQANCCAPINACFNDPQCKSFESCLQGCSRNGSDAGLCEQTCNTDASKNAVAEHNAWAPSCVGKKCATECGL